MSALIQGNESIGVGVCPLRVVDKGGELLIVVFADNFDSCMLDEARLLLNVRLDFAQLDTKTSNLDLRSLSA